MPPTRQAAASHRSSSSSAPTRATIAQPVSGTRSARFRRPARTASRGRSRRRTATTPSQRSRPTTRAIRRRRSGTSTSTGPRRARRSSPSLPIRPTSPSRPSRSPRARPVRRSSAASTVAPSPRAPTRENVAGLTDNNHTFDVRATDAAGNTDATPATWTWHRDTNDPTGTLNNPGANIRQTATLTSSETDPSANGYASGLQSVTYEYSANGTTWAAIGTLNTAPFDTMLWNTTGVTDGVYQLRIVVSDVAGNTTTVGCGDERPDRQHRPDDESERSRPVSARHEDAHRLSSGRRLRHRPRRLPARPDRRRLVDDDRHRLDAARRLPGQLRHDERVRWSLRLPNSRV